MLFSDLSHAACLINRQVRPTWVIRLERDRCRIKSRLSEFLDEPTHAPEYSRVPRSNHERTVYPIVKGNHGTRESPLSPVSHTNHASLRKMFRDETRDVPLIVLSLIHSHRGGAYIKGVRINGLRDDLTAVPTHKALRKAEPSGQKQSARVPRGSNDCLH